MNRAIFACVLRTTFKDGRFQSEIQLLKPVNMDLSIKRNLSAAWYHSIPDNQINAHLRPMSVSSYVSIHFFFFMRILGYRGGGDNKQTLDRNTRRE